MTTIIDIVFKLLDAIIEETTELDPVTAAEARARLKQGIDERAARIANDEADDLDSIPKA